MNQDAVNVFVQQKGEALDEVARLDAVIARAMEARANQLARVERLTFVIEAVTKVMSGGSILDVPFSPGMPTVDVQADLSAKHGRSLEQIIFELFKDGEDGYTSVEVVEHVAKHSDAKKESITSTLSRMVAKGALRRDGKLYFRAVDMDVSGQNQQPSQGAEIEDTKVELDFFKGDTPSAM
jgi:Penicillinase repressor